jgi:DNA/RNA endonuclease G (NUC1)
LAVGAHAEQGLTNCAQLFPGGNVANAPTLLGATPGQPAQENVHICERSGNTPFFALEYAPALFAPLWVSYRISDTFGPKGCASMTRREMQCHWQAIDVEACLNNPAQKPGDPFHADSLLGRLGVARLGIGAFSGTRHDRGHMAPNNSFSWHACGAYKTFTMANMAAQWNTLNQRTWMNLEAQVLFWGVKEGPIHVVTGPIWTKFPVEEFAATRDGVVDTSSIPEPGDLLAKTNGQELPVHILRPTGFYKVVFRPARGNEPARAIAFLVPHTKQTAFSFWLFATSVRTVEGSSGLRFGIDQSLKGPPDETFWMANRRKAPSGWDVRGECDQKLPVAGWMGDRTRKERVAACDSASP